ncbi:unnamed protein product [Symbiodinium necroappetens]|uniref:Uncharacterized protein n=1 Tax=Symbiodinium necroappetens TaxID=1628268 RepID=A0A812XR59_9DINO|nr:unnamed protein product [Symbiodinium necroappetens]
MGGLAVETEAVREDVDTWLEKAAALVAVNPRSAAQMALRAQTLAELAGERGAQARALLVSAQVSLHQGKSNAALTSATRAQRLFKQEADAAGEARAAFEALRAEALQLESGVREPTQTAWETTLRMAEEAAQRAKSSSLHDLSAAALSLRAKALHVLGRIEESAKTVGEASQALQLAGAGADPKLARIAQTAPSRAAVEVKLGREQLEKDPSLVLLPVDTRETELQEVFAKREAAHKEQAEPTVLVRQPTGLLVEAKTSLPFQVAMRRDNVGSTAQVLTRYYQHLRNSKRTSNDKKT